VRVEVCGGTARVPADAVLPQTSVVFDGPGIRHLVVHVRDDAALETAETLELCLIAECAGPVKACSFSKHVLTIYDNDQPPVALPMRPSPKPKSTSGRGKRSFFTPPDIGL
jgi:hypothetical protein